MIQNKIWIRSMGYIKTGIKACKLILTRSLPLDTCFLSAAENYSTFMLRDDSSREQKKSMSVIYCKYAYKNLLYYI